MQLCVIQRENNTKTHYSDHKASVGKGIGKFGVHRK